MFLSSFVDPNSFPPGTFPCRMYSTIGNLERKYKFMTYMAPLPGFIQGNFENINPAVTEHFRIQPALLNIIKRSSRYRSNDLLNNYLLLVVFNTMKLFSFSPEMLNSTLNGRLFDPMSLTTVYACSSLQEISAGVVPPFVDVSKVDIFPYMGALEKSLDTLSASFEARTKCDHTNEHELDLNIYSICAFYMALIYPYPLKSPDGNNGWNMVFPFPSVISTYSSQNGYMNGPFRNFIIEFLNKNIARIFQLGKRIIEFYSDLRIKRRIGKFGDDALKAVNYFIRTPLNPDTCFILPPTLINKGIDLKQELKLITGETVTEQCLSDVIILIIIYLVILVYYYHIKFHLIIHY